MSKASTGFGLRRGAPQDQSTLASTAGHIAAGIPATATLDRLQANIFIADTKLNLVYINPKANETLRKLGSEIEKAFRVRLSDVAGGSIHRFHKDPQRIERILHEPGFRPHDAQFSFGSVTLSAHINQICGTDGEIVGYVVAWEDVTAEVTAQAEAVMAAARLAQTLAKTEEITVALRSVSESMEQMSTATEEIARSGSDTTSMVATTVSVVAAASQTMTDLSGASARIDEVAKTIAAIASQTNLLALNATIEAARAGDAGKGFAVVANEVKELAGQTRTATERIAEMIRDVQALSQAASSAMDDISDMVEKVSAGQNSVAAAVEEQTATNQEINRSLADAAHKAQTVTSEVAAYVNAGN
jgi:predicted  nucleic acid-binding Zn-ribbon protein